MLLGRSLFLLGGKSRGGVGGMMAGRFVGDTKREASWRTSLDVWSAYLGATSSSFRFSGRFWVGLLVSPSFLWLVPKQQPKT